MDGDIREELNKLDKRRLVDILLARKTGDDLKETAANFFRRLFSTGTGTTQDEGGDASEKRKDVLRHELRRVRRESDRVMNEELLETKDDDGRELTKGKFEDGSEGQNDEAECEMGIKTSASDIYGLAQIDSDLKQFHDFCKENRLTDEDIAKICEPLARPMRRKKLVKSLGLAAAFLFVVVFLYCLASFETPAWHYSAIGRLVMIELLPLWHWPQWKNTKCLVPRFDQSPPDSPPPPTCTFCEYIDKIDVLGTPASMNVDFISDRFVKLHRPLIVEGAGRDWASLHANTSAVIEEILDDPVLSESVPCKLATNAYVGAADRLRNVLRKVDTRDVYFLHFENCEFEAVKAFRRLFGRPAFLAPEFSPVQYSWLLMSNRYSVAKFKTLALREQVTVVGQFVGKNVFVLQPANCEEECNALLVELSAGEALVLTSPWNLEYKPDPSGENLAVILETHY